MFMKKSASGKNNKIRPDRPDLKEWISSEQEDMDVMWDYLYSRDKNSFPNLNIWDYDRRSRYQNGLIRNFELFIDESGTPDPIDLQSDIYVLCGCAVPSDERENLKIHADRVKFKYWGRTDLTFHSRTMGYQEKDFKIFKVKIVKETARRMFYHYIIWLFGLTHARGRITIESATAEKDRYYLSEFSRFLSPGCKELDVHYKKVQSKLTSIAFVTKNNDDIEEQIADLFAYASKCKFLRATKQKSFKVGSYEDRMIRVLENKLFQKPKFAREVKMKFYESIRPFCVLP